MNAPAKDSGLRVVALLCAAEVLSMTGFSTYPALLAPLRPGLDAQPDAALHMLWHGDWGAALGHTGRLVDVVGRLGQVERNGRHIDAIALPHPSGASTWHRTQPGMTLLGDALRLFGAHRAIAAALADRGEQP